MLGKGVHRCNQVRVEGAERLSMLAIDQAELMLKAVAETSAAFLVG